MVHGEYVVKACFAHDCSQVCLFVLYGRPQLPVDVDRFAVFRSKSLQAKAFHSGKQRLFDSGQFSVYCLQLVFKQTLAFFQLEKAS